MLRKTWISILFSILIVLTVSSCFTKAPSPSPISNEPDVSDTSPTPTPEPDPIKVPSGTTIADRFNPPTGFTRAENSEDSFEAFLLKQELKPDGSFPVAYNGAQVTSKPIEAVLKWTTVKELAKHTAVFLQLRAEYLFERQQFSNIEFSFVSGFAFSYEKWAEGYRIKVNGNNVQWVKNSEPDWSKEQLDRYLSMLYAYTNALSFKSEVVDTTSAAPGDVMLENGGVMIVDMAFNEEQIAVMLLKGGSPAQEPYIQANVSQPEISPWFIVADNGAISTSEGDFNLNAAKRFDN